MQAGMKVNELALRGWVGDSPLLRTGGAPERTADSVKLQSCGCQSAAFAARGSCVYFPSMKYTQVFFALLLSALTVMAQAPQERAPQVDPNSPAGMAQQARRLSSQGKLDEAWTMAEKAMKADPKNSEAHQAAGIVLDLQDKYAEARKHLQEAIDTAANDREKASARRSLAVSYFFERNGKGAEAAEKPLIDEN